MKRINFALVLWLVCLLATSVTAQDEEPGTLARGFTVTVSPKNVLAFEEAYKKHIEWHAKKEDKWTWDTWQVAAGEDVGRYVIRTPGHHWADFDSPPFGMEDRDHFLEHCAAYVDSVSSVFTDVMSDVSKLPAPDAKIPLITVIEMRIAPGGVMDFMHAITRIHEAIAESNWPAEYVWLTQMHGGEGPTFYLVLLHKNWADAAEPEVPFPAMLEGALGRPEATAVLDLLNEVIVYQKSTMYEYREDLSYSPSE